VKTTYGDVCVGLLCCCCSIACSNFRDDEEGARKEARCFLGAFPTRFEKLSVPWRVLFDLNIMQDVLDRVEQMQDYVRLMK
jgi:hypothetical protein